MLGFISDCGHYGVFKFDKQWMVVYNGIQMEVFKTVPQCKKYIKTHQDSLPTVTPPENFPIKPANIKRSSRRNSAINKSKTTTRRNLPKN
jgi:hypothetical protein